MLRRLKRPLLVALALASTHCGGSDDKKRGPTNATQCPGLVATGAVGHCGETELENYARCVEDACQREYRDCFGTNYGQGQFSGPCADFLECASHCDCADESCQHACATAECTSCMIRFVSCGFSCANKLACAQSSATDGGGDRTTTCADLLSCCSTLGDESRKQQCAMTHGQLSALADDSGCAAALAKYCP